MKYCPIGKYDTILNYQLEFNVTKDNNLNIGIVNKNRGSPLPLNAWVFFLYRFIFALDSSGQAASAYHTNYLNKSNSYPNASNVGYIFFD